MGVQARIALDGGGVYATEVEPERLRAQLADEGSRFLELADPMGFITLIPREKVLMVQYGAGIPSPQEQEAAQQAQFQQMQQQFQQMQQQYQQMQGQMPGAGQGAMQASLGDRAKAKWQQFQDTFMPPQTAFPQQQFPQGQQQVSPGQQDSQNPLHW